MNRRKNRSPRDLLMDRRSWLRKDAPQFIFGITILIIMSAILYFQVGS